MTLAFLRSAAREILRAGLKSVEPGTLVEKNLRVDGDSIRVGSATVVRPRRVFVVSVGKGAIAMSNAAHRLLGGRITRAVVIAPSKAPRRPRTVNFLARHPIPNGVGVAAGHRVIRLLDQAGRDDLVLLLLSGGASALMPAPVEGVTLRDKQRLTRLLLKRGADIHEINTVRKSLSRLKGGGFARIAAPARVITLALSDVPGDDPATIGSGPTVDDPVSMARAREVALTFLKPSELRGGVTKALSRRRAKTRVTNATTMVIGNGVAFARAAAKKARSLGFTTAVLRNELKGEARERGPALVAEFTRRRRSKALCLIATGETVVTVKGNGTGGRNQELALSAIPSLAKRSTAAVMVTFATDGRDGPTSSSGGVITNQTAAKAHKLRISLDRVLDRNDSNTALRELRGLLETGETGTNVADVAIILG